MANDILTWVAGLLGTIVTTVLIPYAVSWLQLKVKNEKLKYALDDLGEAVATSVNYVNQSFVDQLKVDGKFDPENQKKALELATKTTLDTLTKTTKKILGSDGIDLQNMIVKYIESYIMGSKTKNPQDKASTPVGF